IFKPLHEIYLEFPDMSKEAVRTYLDENDFKPFGMSRISIRFYMEESDREPDEKIYDEIYQNLEEVQGIPKGRYTLILNDNYINRKSARAEKENTINKTSPDKMEKK